MDQQYIACQHANEQFYRINAPFQPLTNPPSCITALHAKNDQAIKEQCSLSIFHVACTFIPVEVTSHLWIIPSNPETLGSAITIICSDKATSTVPLQQPFTTLKLSPVCSATSRYFHLLPHYEDHTFMINVSLDTQFQFFNLMQIYIVHWEDCIHLIYCTSQCFLHRPTFSVLYDSFLRGSHPLPDQLPGEHTGLLSQAEQCLFLSFGPSVQCSHICLLIVDRSMVVGACSNGPHMFFYVH